MANIKLFNVFGGFLIILCLSSVLFIIYYLMTLADVQNCHQYLPIVKFIMTIRQYGKHIPLLVVALGHSQMSRTTFLENFLSHDHTSPPFPENSGEIEIACILLHSSRRSWHALHCVTWALHMSSSHN